MATGKKKVVVSGSKAARVERGVIYLSNVPDGFCEGPMRRFFGQFGVVTDLRLGRSTKTGRSRGYAFVEFRYREVAEVVARTMDGYLMFERLMKCKMVPEERVRRAMFGGKFDPRDPPGMRARLAAKRAVNARRTGDERCRMSSALKRAAARLRAVAGIDLKVEFPPGKEGETKRKEVVMRLDESDREEITLKTPPNVRKEVVARTARARKKRKDGKKLGAK